MAESAQQVHTIKAFIPKDARILMLGSFPSPKSRETGFFYGHPQNRFWKVLAAVFNVPVPETIEEKKAMLQMHHIALWDVLASCRIEGASDSSIKNAVPNNIADAVKGTDIRAVFTTGQKAGALYKRYCMEKTNLPLFVLPSTSPANRTITENDIIKAYRQITDYLA